jgi:dTDP-4-dehydrorhamnose reductase
MKILLLGKNGQLGWELHRSLLPLGSIIALDRKQCDLSCPEKIHDVVSAIHPEAIVNAAAYTAVDKAEDEEELATAINGTSVKVLAEEAQKMKALLVHYSTDYVFNGNKADPYTEDDIPDPVNAYGRSKLEGEQAIVKSGSDYIVLRTSWVYAARGNNFLKTMLRLARERGELRIVADQYGAPTWARNIADATVHMLVTAQRERQASVFSSNIYHLSATGKTTWHGFANAIIEQARHIGEAEYILTEKILPITTEDYPLPAPRPKNSQMVSGLLTARFGLTMPEWHEAMKLCIDEVLEVQ